MCDLRVTTDMRTHSPPHHDDSESGYMPAEEGRGGDDPRDRRKEQLEIVMQVSIRDPENDGEPQRLPPVSVTVDRRTLSGSPVQVKIGVQGNMK